jgi:hypothetical protein
MQEMKREHSKQGRKLEKRETLGEQNLADTLN